MDQKDKMWINLLPAVLGLMHYFLMGVQADAATDYNEVHSDGSFSFGLSNNDVGGHYHTASGSADKIVRGRYGSRNSANGRIEETVYTAGPRGYRARGPQIARKMDLSQYPRGPVGSPDDPLADPYDDPSYSFNFKTLDYDRQENADSTGRVRGLYSYLDDIGEKHTVRYAAGAGTGFEVLNAVPDTPASVAYSSPLYKAPVGTRGRMSVVRGPDGQYKFILSGPDQRRSESSGPDGIVRGSYSYLDDKGIQRTVQYIAGAGIGYRVVKSTIGSGTHLAPRPALPEYGIRDFQSNDLADDGYLHTAESGRILPKGDGFGKGGSDSSQTGRTRPNKIDDRGDSELYDRRKSGTSGDRDVLRRPNDRDFISSEDKKGRPQVSGGKTSGDGVSQQGGYDYRKTEEDYDRQSVSGEDRRKAERGPIRDSEYKNRDQKLGSGGDRNRGPDGLERGQKQPALGSGEKILHEGVRNRKPETGGFGRKPFDTKGSDDDFSSSPSPYLPRDRLPSTIDQTAGSLSREKDSKNGIHDDGSYKKTSTTGSRGDGYRDRDDGSYRKTSTTGSRGDGYRDTDDILTNRGRVSTSTTTSSRKKFYDDDDDGNAFPLVTTDLRRLEVDREKDWSLRGRDSTVIKNVGKWYIGLPPGAAVRAHVQNIDLLPLNGRIPSPSEALRRDELGGN